MLSLGVALIASGVVGLEPRTVAWGEVVQIALGVAALLNAGVLLGARASGRIRRRWTPAAAHEAARWNAFRRYLRDFPRLQEAPPSSVVLWERLLVYGIAFGLADRVLQAAKLAAPSSGSDGGGGGFSGGGGGGGGGGGREAW